MNRIAFCFRLLMICLWMGPLALPATAGRIAAAETVRVGEIVVSRLHMRSAPDRAAASVAILARGTRVHIAEDLGPWLKINYQDRSGYIRNRKEYVTISNDFQKAAPEGASRRTHLPVPSELKVKSDRIDREIKKHHEEVLNFTQKEADLVDDLNEIDLSVHRARTKVAEFKQELDAIEKEIGQANTAAEKLEADIQTGEAYIAKRLVALYKLNWFGKIHVLASAESVYGLFQRKAALERILSHDEKVRRELISNKTRLGRIHEALDARQREKRALESKYRQQAEALSLERTRRSALLTEIRNKKSLELAALDSLKRSAAELDRKISMLNIETKKRSEAVNVFEKSFNELKGLLNMPVKGKIITRFGLFKNSRFNVENFRSGIDIRADRGEPVRAVSSGRVLYASWFKGYGNMLIIDHSHNYCTVYAHVEELFKSKGDTVEAHEVVATVGDTGSMEGPELYFEVRHHGKPQDPLEWIKKG